MNSKLKLDPHTHTVASGHAYSSLQEMVAAAQQKGLDILGITEHAPGIPGTCDPIYFRNLHVVPRQMGSLRLLLGAELDILDTKGTLDLDEYYYKQLDIRIAGIHLLCWEGGTIEENTQGMINAIHNPWTQIISHPGDGTAELLRLCSKSTTAASILAATKRPPSRTTSRYCGFASDTKCRLS